MLQRILNICLTPTKEWPIIAGEAPATASLITGYVVPLAAIGAAAGFIGGSFIGYSAPFLGTYRVPIVTGLGAAVFTLAMAIVGTFILSVVINVLAPTFGGEPNSAQAFKVAVYSYTPAWIAGALQIIPPLGALALIGALYGLYLLYLGLPRLMKCPEDKAIGYTVVVVICAIILSVVVTVTGGLIVGAGAVGAGALGSRGPLGALAAAGGRAGSDSIQFDKDSAMGKLQDFAKKMDESSKKMEAAQKSGDATATASAAMDTLGTLLGGGKHIDPIGVEQLKPFVPETFAGMPQTSSKVEKTGFASLMVSRADATYGESGKSAGLAITDTGGASGLTSLAGWAGLQIEREDADGFEHTRKENGRLVHEKVSKAGGGETEYDIVLGDRFVVAATGHRVGLDDLKAAVSRLNLGTLEGMKDVGVR
ncbi:MAG TPA: Yip1 family protein [Vicinamibacterales bacterium]|jgi:hypothetical protein|nr:Yip1 family protein [Vicinamibacterales bacterium]